MALENMMRSVGEAIRPAIAGAMALRERWRSGVGYNPLSGRTAQDPYPLYAALRARSPVHRSTLLNAGLFTRHAVVVSRSVAGIAGPVGMWVRLA